MPHRSSSRTATHFRPGCLAAGGVVFAWRGGRLRSAAADLHRSDEAVATPGHVSMNRGESAASPSASRKRMMAAFSPCSKSRKVLSGQSPGATPRGSRAPRGGGAGAPAPVTAAPEEERGRQPCESRQTADRPQRSRTRRGASVICSPETSSAPGSAPRLRTIIIPCRVPGVIRAPVPAPSSTCGVTPTGCARHLPGIEVAASPPERGSTTTEVAP